MHHTPHKKMKFSIKDFSSENDQICRKLRSWLHLMKKSLMENFIFYAAIHGKVIMKIHYDVIWASKWVSIFRQWCK